MPSAQPCTATSAPRTSRPDRDPAGPAAGEPADELGLLERGGADHDPGHAGVEQRLGRRPRRGRPRRPAPACRTDAGDRGDHRPVHRLAAARRVEVDDVDPRRAGVGEHPRLADRVVAVDGLAVEVALVQAHAPPVAQVDRGVQLHHAPPPAQRSTKLASMRRPLRRRLLGVELGGPHGAPLDRGHDRAAVVARGDRVGRVLGRERVHEVHPRRVGQPGEQRARALHVEHVPLHLRVLHARRAAGRSARAARRGRRRPATPRTPRRASACRRRCRGTAGRRATASTATSASPRLGSDSMQRPNAPTPGSTTPAASAMSPWSAVSRASAPTRWSAFWAERRLPMP